MAKEYKNTLKQLSEKLKTEKPTTPIQEVRPVDDKATAGGVPALIPIPPKKEAHMNFWVPEELMERLKIHSAKSKKTIKQIGIEALEQFLPKDL